ncbi:hypothetical protein SDC9_184357 [bioreactor metagenome]|uniref:Uncharacterized protein n=1 Tax=bioreactor metagenome TaxID=1076179 RepID=A0A645HCT3_9ZZZZ
MNFHFIIHIFGIKGTFCQMFTYRRPVTFRIFMEEKQSFRHVPIIQPFGIKQCCHNLLVSSFTAHCLCPLGVQAFACLVQGNKECKFCQLCKKCFFESSDRRFIIRIHECIQIFKHATGSTRYRYKFGHDLLCFQVIMPCFQVNLFHFSGYTHDPIFRRSCSDNRQIRESGVEVM